MKQNEIQAQIRIAKQTNTSHMPEIIKDIKSEYVTRQGSGMGSFSAMVMHT